LETFPLLHGRQKRGVSAPEGKKKKGFSWPGGKTKGDPPGRKKPGSNTKTVKKREKVKYKLAKEKTDPYKKGENLKKRVSTLSAKGRPLP